MECNNELRATVLEALRGASEACEALSRYALEAADHLRSGEIREGNELLSGIVDDFSHLVGLLMDVSRIDGFGTEGEQKPDSPLGKESQAMTDLLNMAMEAQENQDWVFLADILEYELAEKLGAWNGLFAGLLDPPEAGSSL